MDPRRGTSHYTAAVPSTFFFFSSRRRHTRCSRDWSSDVCSSDLLKSSVMQILALDVGTSSVKAAILDVATATLVGPVARASYTLDYPTADAAEVPADRKSTRLNSSHGYISYAVFCLKKKTTTTSSAPAKTWSKSHGTSSPANGFTRSKSR